MRTVRLLYAESHCKCSVLFLSTAFSSYLPSFCCCNIGQTVPHAYAVGFSCPCQSQILEQWELQPVELPGNTDARARCMVWHWSCCPRTGILGISPREYGDLIQEVFGDSLSLILIVLSIKELSKFLKLQKDKYLLELFFSPLFGIRFSGAFFSFLSVLAARQRLDVHIKSMWLNPGS